ncbi:hypothetical protein A0256_05270 [Mucilaginibacter sp. PAMC 26640]|nr:hypothetical protein A0256_05270 [Mucilaginibacter sp. PAMC 26640]
MNSIEEQLWNYIDGFCTPEEEKTIAALIAGDERYSSKYAELLQLNQEFGAQELDEPSMAFSYKVMETIRTENSRQPLKAAINKRIIWGIAGFFIVTIAALVLLSLGSVNWTGAGAVSFDIKMPEQLNFNQVKNMFTAPVLKGFLFFDVVMGLFLLDAYLRRKPLVKN